MAVLIRYCTNQFHNFDQQVSLSGHLFDKFLINEALDIIEAAGGSFQLVRCQVGQSTNDISVSELEVSSLVFRIEIEQILCSMF